jgi:hypothetical protein
MTIRVAVLVMLLGLAACQTSPQTQELLGRNQDLEQRLTQARSEIASLTADNNNLQANVQELNRVIAVLDTEKTSRVEESSEVRSQVRGFVQTQIDAFKEFLILGDLMDYIGSELINRNWVENEPLLLVDLGNQVPRNGSLIGVAAHLNAATPFMVKILRPIEDEFVVIWESQMITAEKAGVVRKPFAVSVGIEQGDYLAYYFPQTTGVSFDEGTGSTFYISRDVKLGESIRRTSLKGADKKRSYSIGVYGLLNLK